MMPKKIEAGLESGIRLCLKFKGKPIIKLIKYNLQYKRWRSISGLFRLKSFVKAAHHFE